MDGDIIIFQRDYERAPGVDFFHLDLSCTKFQLVSWLSIVGIDIVKCYKFFLFLTSCFNLLFVIAVLGLSCSRKIYPPLQVPSLTVSLIKIFWRRPRSLQRLFQSQHQTFIGISTIVLTLSFTTRLYPMIQALRSLSPIATCTTTWPEPSAHTSTVTRI